MLWLCVTTNICMYCTYLHVYLLFWVCGQLNIVNNNWLCRREQAIFDPPKIAVPELIAKMFGTGDYICDPFPVPNLVQIHTQGGICGQMYEI